MVSANSFVLMTLLAAAPSVEIWEFTAPWCESCQTMDPVVHKLAGEGIPIRQIPFDDYRELAAQAKVTQLPGFLVVNNGKVLGRHVGRCTERELRALIQANVPQPFVATREEGRPGQRVAGPVIRGQQPQPRGLSRIGSAFSSFTDRFSRNPSKDEWNEPRDNGPPLVAPARLSAEDSPQELTPLATLPPSTPVPSFAPPVPATRLDTLEPAISATPGNSRYSDPVVKATNATVLLRVQDPTGVSLGTGTVVDVHDGEALVLTCGHIFRDSQGKGVTTCELQGAPAGRKVAGQVISFDLKRDIGLVSFRPDRLVEPVRVAGPGYLPQQRDPVFAVGCSQGAPATVIKNQILSVNRYNGPANLVVGGRPIDGRSGGGLFNQHGLLIGVCNAADPEADEGLYAALGPIHTELESTGLDFIFRGEDSTPQTMPLTATIQPVDTHLSAATAPVTLASHTASVASTDTEVICIVRPKGSGADAGKAYVLDKPSKRLLHQLSEELGKRGPHQFTGKRQSAAQR